MSTFQWIKNIKHNKKLFPAILLLVTIVTDQYTKFLAAKLFEFSSEIAFLKGFLAVSFIRNYDGFLGIVNNLSDTYKFFLLYVCVSFLLLGCLVYLFGLNKKTTRYDLSLVFVTGGGISNLLDRLLHNGGVADFLSVGVGNFQTGIFNLADIYILIGSFFLGYSFFSTSEMREQPPITDL